MEQSLALYRRYRPETFAEVIGQDHVTGPLRQALANNRVNHAYLFSGPRGCGKTTSARILARALNCEKAPISDPCGECQSCRDLARGGPGSIDVIEIDAASHGGVDDARDLRERAFFAPVSSRYKVYIIDEAHMVTTQGFNALLKLVEEPPEHLKFIFATTAPDKVLGTIRSRTHHYPFRLIPPRTLSDYLAKLCQAEGVPIDAAALPLVVRAGAGSARDSLSVLDQLIGGAGPDGVTYSVAAALLGYTPDNLLDDVVDAISAGDGATVFGVVDRVIEVGQDPRRFTEDLLRRLRDLVILAAAPDATSSGLLDVSGDAAERLSAQAARFGRAELVRAADIVAAGLTEMRGATAPRLLLELICARLLLPAADDSRLGFGARLDRLERRINAGPMPSMGSVPAPTDPMDAGSSAAAARAAISASQVPTEQQAPPQVQEPAQAAAAPQPVAEPTVSKPPAPTAAEVPSRPTPPADAPPAPSTPTATTSPLGQADLRRLWPEVLERVRSMKRFTWILLKQNAQVVGVDGTTLTLGFRNAGARESFVGGGSDQILRQALIDLIGADWRVEAIVDPSTDPERDTAPRVIKPAVEEAGPAEPTPAEPGPTGPTAIEPRPTEPTTTDSIPTPAPASPAAPTEMPPAQPAATRPPPPRPPAPETVAKARQAIGTDPVAPVDPDEFVDRDDPTIEDDGLHGAALLQRELGATVIEEIPHEK